jgi:NAD(P)-dependent dehydrogenase (short-subunit alcohol dehydrogenase family)
VTRVALVTGGETGIGRAIVSALTSEDFEVHSVSRRTGHDLANRDAIRALAATFKKLDLLVNNAGIADAAPLGRTDDEAWDAHLAINVTAPFLLCRELLPALQGGQIINICSTASLRGGAYVSAYTASKHALLGLTRALAQELKGVRVDAVCPGFVDSPLTKRSIAQIVEKTGRSTDEARDALAEENPSRRLIQPKEVAEAVLDLVRTQGTGREIVLD